MQHAGNQGGLRGHATCVITQHHLPLAEYSAAFPLCPEPPKCVAKPVKESRSIYSLDTNKESAKSICRKQQRNNA